MDLRLKDKVVVVSGSAGKEGSIGETIINRLADEQRKATKKVNYSLKSLPWKIRLHHWNTSPN